MYASTLFRLLGKFAISCAFTSLFVYSSEVFPTVFRNGCIGACVVVARLGGAFAPAVRTMVGLVRSSCQLPIANSDESFRAQFCQRCRQSSLPSSRASAAASRYCYRRRSTRNFQIRLVNLLTRSFFALITVKPVICIC